MIKELLKDSGHCHSSEQAAHRMGKQCYPLYLTEGWRLRIYKEFKKLNNKKTNNPNKNGPWNLAESSQKKNYTWPGY